MRSIDRSLISLLDDDVGRRTLARLTEAQVRVLASQCFHEDVYRCATTARRALESMRGVQVSDALVEAHVEHTLWAAWRSAGRVVAPASWQVEGLDCLRATDGEPTILVTPYTVPWTDTLLFAETHAAHRPLVFYGEGLHALPRGGTRHPELHVLGEASVRNSLLIMRVLDRGGIFCTFCDFVYDAHPSIDEQLFGRARPLSSAFLSLCARPGVHLLPLLLSREGGEMRAKIHDPVVFGLPSQLERATVRRLMSQTVARLLESLIRERPEQWLLLPTLAAAANRSLPQHSSSQDAQLASHSALSM